MEGTLSYTLHAGGNADMLKFVIAIEATKTYALDAVGDDCILTTHNESACSGLNDAVAIFMAIETRIAFLYNDTFQAISIESHLVDLRHACRDDDTLQALAILKSTLIDALHLVFASLKSHTGRNDDRAGIVMLDDRGCTIVESVTDAVYLCFFHDAVLSFDVNEYSLSVSTGLAIGADVLDVVAVLVVGSDGLRPAAAMLVKDQLVGQAADSILFRMEHVAGKEILLQTLISLFGRDCAPIHVGKGFVRNGEFAHFLIYPVVIDMVSRQPDDVLVLIADSHLVLAVNLQNELVLLFADVHIPLTTINLGEFAF